jgi:D-alanyl-D-alanine dipeptidase
MCTQGVVQNLSQRQAPNHLAQVKNQLKQVDLEEVDPFFKNDLLAFNLNKFIKRPFMGLFLC